MKKILAVVFAVAAILTGVVTEFSNHPPVMTLESHQHQSQTDIA
ncbi:hypothetical protein ACFDTO_14805 [Microbacteriaceae bacterium 4G12]